MWLGMRLGLDHEEPQSLDFVLSAMGVSGIYCHRECLGGEGLQAEHEPGGWGQG